MRRDQINQQHRTDEVAAGKNGKFYAPTFWWPPNEEALEVTLLRLVNAEVHLRQCPRENECHPRGQTDDGQFQRGDEIEEFIQHSLLGKWGTNIAQKNSERRFSKSPSLLIGRSEPD